MTTITSSVTVAQTATAVFDYLVDPANQVHWSPNFQALEQAPPGAPELGTRFRGKLKNFGSLEFVYDEFERPRTFRMATDHRTGHMTHRFIVSEAGAGTQVTHEVGFEPAGLARLGAPLMRPLLAKMVADLDRQLKATLGRLPAAGAS
jgi:uncharacterized protein YndB with AHSA1/START domain